MSAVYQRAERTHFDVSFCMSHRFNRPFHFHLYTSLTPFSHFSKYSSFSLNKTLHYITSHNKLLILTLQMTEYRGKENEQPTLTKSTKKAPCFWTPNIVSKQIIRLVSKKIISPTVLPFLTHPLSQTVSKKKQSSWYKGNFLRHSLSLLSPALTLSRLVGFCTYKTVTLQMI